jgi:hypothetical protein
VNVDGPYKPEHYRYYVVEVTSEKPLWLLQSGFSSPSTSELE